MDAAQARKTPKQNSFMNKHSITGLVLIFLIFVGYMWWVSPSKEEMAQMQARHDSAVQAYNDSVALADSLAAIQQELQAKIEQGDSDAIKQMQLANRIDMGAFNASGDGDNQLVQINNDLMQIAISPKGAMVQEVILNDYTTFDKRPLQLVSSSEDNLDLMFYTTDNKLVQSKDLYFVPFIDGKRIVAGEPITVAKDDSLTISFRAFASNDSVNDGNSYLEYRYQVNGDSYEVDFDIVFHNLDQAVKANPDMDLSWSNRMLRQEKVDPSARNSRNPNKDPERFYSNIFYKPSKDNVDELKRGGNAEKSTSSSLQWIAYKQQFFCAILMADNRFESAKMEVNTDKADTNMNYLCDMSSTMRIAYESKPDYTMGMNFYFGPSKYRDLRAMHKDFERMLPLGWGFFLTQWISRFAIIPVFNFLEQFNWNYGIIVIILTFLLRLVLFPLTFKSYQGSAIMRILRPEMEALNKKYPNQDQMMQKQQEMTRLQKRAGYSPMAGCLPALVQFPIIWAMFRFYPASIELRQQPFLWCNDLSTYDSILNFGFTIPLYGDHVSLFCLLMFGVQFFYTWYTMKSQQGQATMPGMKFMMYFMPFMMLFLFNSQSAALNLYYFCSLSLTMLQMILIHKFTSEKKVRARMAAYDVKNKNVPQKKSKFQQRLEEMQKMSEEMQKQQAKRK